MEEKGLDQLLYEAYCKESNEIQGSKHHYLPWENLPVWIQHCWASVADTAVEHTRKPPIIREGSKKMSNEK